MLTENVLKVGNYRSIIIISNESFYFKPNTTGGEINHMLTEMKCQIIIMTMVNTSIL